MSEVFADTFFYIALLNPADQHHAAAVRHFATVRRPMLTTAWVLTEVADAFSSPATRRTTHRFLGELAARTQTRIIPADDDLFRRGLALYGARPDKAWSLTDCISFEVMRESGLSDALTGDHHYEQAGFRAVFLRP